MYIADLHIHSRYSRATSKDCTPEYLELWARKKGIQIVGTGDFTHPAWREELAEKLAPAEEGLYVLKEEYRIRDGVTDDSLRPRFVVTGEISSIYKKGGKVRKVHSVLMLPGLEAAELLSRKLDTIGNIHSDGRPILGLDCHDLLEIMLELCPEAVYIPAHIWTPHFSLFGAFSGFDTIEECFGDLTPYIHALETGLSSDPPMNWRLSALDSFQLVSNSDAHSPSKLGREANLFQIKLCYPELAKAIQQGMGLEGTIEFFPEEGKYHFDGHRKCHLCLSPSEALKYEGRCPVCGRKLTIGVSHRVEELADRAEGFVPKGAKPFESLVPLPEVIAASTGRSAAGVKVQAEYDKMLRRLGSEFAILREVPLEDIKKASGYLISEGIKRLRAGLVDRAPGFDGEYGTIKLFEPWEIDNLDGQISLFTGMSLAGMESAVGAENTAGRENVANQGNALGQEPTAVMETAAAGMTEREPDSYQQLNSNQKEAVTTAARAVAVIAGPGTGKTKTLVSRVLYLLNERKVKPSEITAVTFTKKAAAEMRERLEKQAGGKRTVNQMRIGTFHSICSQILRDQGIPFALADAETAMELAAEIVVQYDLPLKPKMFLQQVSLWKTGMPADPSDEIDRSLLTAAFSCYQERLRRDGALDFDDLLLEVLRCLEAEEKNRVRKQNFSFLLVDEFQDVNPLQYRLIRAWNKGGRELFVIGDPDQAIYGFRGADEKCFNYLERDYPELRTVRLTQNYRCAPPIIGGALGVISKNPGPERISEPVRVGGMPIRVISAVGELPEGIFAAKEINRLIGGIDMLDAQDYLDGPRMGKLPGFSTQEDERSGGRYSFADIAVLYRTHRQAELLEMCLRKEGIPYVTAGRDDFLAEKTVRGTICFFKSLSEHEPGMARRQCLKLLWELQETTISESVYEAMREKYRPMLAKTKPQKIIEAWIVDLGLKKDKNMEKLLGMAKLCKNMAELLDNLTFGTEGDLKRCGGKVYTSDAVTLMTLHGSKGLEFPVVLICGVRKGLIPLEVKGKLDPGVKEKAQCLDLEETGLEETDLEETDLEETDLEETDLGEMDLGELERQQSREEERRLFYVGMTRARDELILVASADESEFLSDLPDEFLIREKADRRKNADSGVQLSLFDFM